MRIIRTNRKTLALQVAKDATLIIRAPQRLSMRFIERFVEKNRPWIEKKQQKARETFGTVLPKAFQEGEEFLYLGERYKLAWVEGGGEPLVLDSRGFELLRDCREEARELFLSWYRRQACDVLGERVAFYSGLTGLKARQIKITSAKTRWGSCSPNGTLSFTWRLVMAPESVLDYVVVHELAHTEHPNHSKKFWGLVEKVLPRYREAKAWLRRHEALLEF